MISRFFTTTATIKRMVYSGDKATQGTAGTMVCHIQMASDKTKNFDESLKITHFIYCPKTTSVVIGDIIEAGGLKYRVRMVQNELVTSTGANQHKKLFCEYTA